MKSTKVLIALSSLGIVGVSLANAQAIQNTISGQTGTGLKLMTTLTDAQKSVLEQAKTLFKAGKDSEAKNLLSTSGIKIPFVGRKHSGSDNRKAIEDAILSGNFITFQQVASTSPLKNIDQSTFTKLTAQYTAKKNAEDQIRSILKAAGVNVPEPGTNHFRNKTTK